jgi:hypothetical protein
MQPTIHWNVNLDMAFSPDVLWVEFSIPPGSLSLVKYCSFNLVVGRKILLDIMSD